jgi:hypothetical protein
VKNIRLILVSILALVVWSQTSQAVQAATIDNGSFMSLWSTYSNCQAATDVDQLRENALTLTNAADHSLTQEGFVLPLPDKLEKLVSAPSVRFAVDVNAMAAACSLRAGSAAVAAGRLALAKELLQTVLNYQSQPDLASYVIQAKALLSEIQPNVIEVTLNRP